MRHAASHSMVISAFAALMALAGFVSSVSASDELETILLFKFDVMNKAEIDRVRAVVNEAVAKAKDLKEIDPDRGLDDLRAAANRVDKTPQLPPVERKAISELLQPLMQEMRENSLLKRREKASTRIDAFKEYLEISANEGKAPGRSGTERWEPAVFWTPDGLSRPGKLYGLGTGAVTMKYGAKEINAIPQTLPMIQVYGGIYAFDKQNGHHVFLTNRDAYNFLWAKAAADFAVLDKDGKPKLASRPVRLEDNRRLAASIDSGEFFLRSLPNLEPIPGVPGDESPYLEFLVQILVQKGLPVPIDRIYPFEMQDRLNGLTKIQLSAVKRTLFLLQAKDTAVSPLYAEILREETAKVLRSEYPNFQIENDVNRAILYIFSKLK